MNQLGYLNTGFEFPLTPLIAFSPVKSLFKSLF